MTDTAPTTPTTVPAPEPKPKRRKPTPPPPADVVAPTSEQKPARAKKGKAAEDEHARIRIKIRAYDHKIIDESSKTIVEAAKRSGANVRGPVPLPTERRRYTVNRSPFIDKDARDQYEMRIHKRLLDIVDPTPKTIEVLTSLSLPAGVSIEVKM
ncbi:30S ribosomal protein S10 [Candidatus Uhrbacteria bacterium]|nr:30S ribosomal protein S10 [Candidatus Uhrbacteria bacterium]